MRTDDYQSTKGGIQTAWALLSHDIYAAVRVVNVMDNDVVLSKGSVVGHVAPVTIVTHLAGRPVMDVPAMAPDEEYLEKLMAEVDVEASAVVIFVSCFKTSKTFSLRVSMIWGKLDW